MKTLFVAMLVCVSVSASAAVTCVTKKRTDTGSKVLSTKVVTGTYGSDAGISSDATKLYSEKGHTFLAATRDTRDGLEIVVTKAIPGKFEGSVYVVKSFGLENVRVYDNFITVTCSNK